MKLVATLKGLFVLGVALRLHHVVHGPPLDYATLGAAAFASWIGVPGPGEPVLIAAGVLAAKHKLGVGETLLVAFAGAAAGGIAGWVVGIKAGRALVQRPGPFHRTRQKALARGEEVFARYPAAAVLLTPSWIAGINHTRAAVFLFWNAVGAAGWALGIGLGAYFVGPPVVDLVGDLGLVTALGAAGLVAVGVALEFGRRRRRGRSGAAHDG